MTLKLELQCHEAIAYVLVVSFFCWFVASEKLPSNLMAS